MFIMQTCLYLYRIYFINIYAVARNKFLKKQITMEKEFNREAGLKTIYAMIESAKGRIGDNYLYYLLWGYLVVITCALEYILITAVHYGQHYLVWPVLMGLGMVASGILTWRQKRTSKHKTFIGNVMSYLWGGWFIGFIILLLFANLRQDYEIILPVTLVMYGLGIFISGGVIDFKPLLYGGLLAWAGSVIAFFQPYTVQLLITMAVVLVSYIIPGHMLRTLSKKQA